MTRHDTDLVSLAFGLLFAAIGLGILADARFAVSWAWLAPAIAIGFGVILIAAGWRRRGPASDPTLEG